MERFAPAALPPNPRAKTSLRSVSVKRRVVGEPAALRPAVQQLHVEDAVRAWADATPFKGLVGEAVDAPVQPSTSVSGRSEPGDRSSCQRPSLSSYEMSVDSPGRTCSCAACSAALRAASCDGNGSENTSPTL